MLSLSFCLCLHNIYSLDLQPQAILSILEAHLLCAHTIQIVADFNFYQRCICVAR